MLEGKGKFIGTIPEGNKVICEGKVIMPDGKEITLEGTYKDKGLHLKEEYKKGYIIQKVSSPNWFLSEVTNKVIGSFMRIDIDAICEVEV